MKKLQSESASPLYHQLMQRLRADIEQGKYPVGSQIPPEHELVELYRVSRVTVRRALSELTGEGLLERKQGKGTFVSAPRTAKNLKVHHSFHDSCRLNHRKPSTDVIHVKEITAGKEDAEELNLAEGSRVLEILRVRRADGTAVVLERDRFSLAYAWLQDQELDGSLYDLLREYGVEPQAALHDVSLRQADAREAELLETEPGETLVCLRGVVFDQRGRPMHNSVQLIRGDRFVFRI
jgi:Transcriptional regulators